MQVTYLKPIDSNLRRIQLAFGNAKHLEQKAGKASNPSRKGSLSFINRLEELHFALLGTMVVVQGITNASEVRIHLDNLRNQILVYRRIMQVLEEADFFHQDELKALSNLLLITFYDLEGILRRRSKASKDQPRQSRSDLVAAIAENSKTALALSLKQGK